MKGKTMQAFINLLKDSEYGVEVPYGHNAYTAYVTEDIDRGAAGGYDIRYCKGMMPPHATDHVDTAEQAAAKIAEIADLSQAREIESE